MKKQMKKTVDIYFGDLTKKAQKNILEYLDISSAKELNWDVYPIATIQIEVLEEE